MEYKVVFGCYLSMELAVRKHHPGENTSGFGAAPQVLSSEAAFFVLADLSYY